MTAKMRIIRRTKNTPPRPTDALLQQALVKARVLIESGRERYICWALEDVGAKNRDLAPATWYLRWYVMTMLLRQGGMSTIETYLVKRFGSQHNHNPREVRLQWIDWMKGTLDLPAASAA